jgi:hypothetical protein
VAIPGKDAKQWALVLWCSVFHYFAYLCQVWPPKSGSYLLTVLLMMGILVPETCWGNKTAYFVASSRFCTFTVSVKHGHMNVKFHSRSECGPCYTEHQILCICWLIKEEFVDVDGGYIVYIARCSTMIVIQL